ncbi:hypothetical protein ACTXT7_004600 [Hymenolepis weldensis]
MATVSTVPNDFVPTAASNVNASAGLRYDSILADACAFNRRLRKGRVNRLDFFDSATQIAQRPAPWLHRSVQARTKKLSVSIVEKDYQQARIESESFLAPPYFLYVKPSYLTLPTP